MTTRARRALRPSLLSKTTPLTASPSLTVATAQQWRRTWTPASRTMSLVASLRTSGSTVGGHWTTPRRALVGWPQYGAGGVARQGGHAVDPDAGPPGGDVADDALALPGDIVGASAGGGDGGGRA